MVAGAIGLTGPSVISSALVGGEPEEEAAPTLFQDGRAINAPGLTQRLRMTASMTKLLK